MKNLVRNLIVFSCVGGSAWAAPFLAIGDNAELFLTGSAGVRYDSNILLAPDSLRKDDTVSQIVPGFDLEFGKDSLIKGSLTGQETLNSYYKHSELNTQLGAVAFNSTFDNGKLKLGANAGYTQLDQNTYAANGTNLRRDLTNAGVTGEISISDKTSIGSGVSYAETRYLNGTGSVNEKDYTVPVNVYYGITPKVDLSSGVTYTRSDLANGIKYDTYYYNVGARGEFTPKLSGNFSIGYNDRNGKGATATDSSGLGLQTGLAYAYTEKTQFTLNASRDFGNGASGDSQEQTSVTLGGQTNLASDWQVNADLTYRLIDYKQAGSPSANYYEATVGATYVINANLSVNGSYLFRGNQSDLSNQGFTDNVLALSITGRY